MAAGAWPCALSERTAGTSPGPQARMDIRTIRTALWSRRQGEATQDEGSYKALGISYGTGHASCKRAAQGRGRLLSLPFCRPAQVSLEK